MSRGRRIARVKFIPPNPKTRARYLREWDPRQLYHHPEEFGALTSRLLFKRDAPLTLEIGCGTGVFLIACAELDPAGCYLGVEVSRRTVYHAVNAAARKDLENILFIRSDFNLLYPLIAPASLAGVHLIFPDPNLGGARRQKNRIFSARFLDLMATALSPAGILQVVTDQPDLLKDMLMLVQAEPRLARTHSEDYLPDFESPVKTRFQRAWEKFDRPLFRFVLSRTS
jgi:tRNA (guanine-N7-)-methyltransferase